MISDRIVIDEQKKWIAVVEFSDDCANLAFETKDGYLLQGDVDETLGFDDIPTGILDLSLSAADGRFYVFYDDYSEEEILQIKDDILIFLKNIYNENKKAFVKNIKNTIKYY